MDEETKKVVIQLKDLLGKREDLDVLVFMAIETRSGKELSQGDKAYIRYMLDQDQASRTAMQNKNNYDEDSLEKWK